MAAKKQSTRDAYKLVSTGSIRGKGAEYITTPYAPVEEVVLAVT